MLQLAVGQHFVLLLPVGPQAAKLAPETQACRPLLADRGTLGVEECLLDRVGRERARGVVGRRGFGVAAETAQQVGACRVEQVVAVQARGTQLVHGGQADCGAVDFGERDGAVERDDRGRRECV